MEVCPSTCGRRRDALSAVLRSSPQRSGDGENWQKSRRAHLRTHRGGKASPRRSRSLLGTGSETAGADSWRIGIPFAVAGLRQRSFGGAAGGAASRQQCRDHQSPRNCRSPGRSGRGRKINLLGCAETWSGLVLGSGPPAAREAVRSRILQLPGLREEGPSDLAFVLTIVLIAIPDRTHRPPVLRVVNLHPAIHVLQMDARTALSDVAAQILPDELMAVDP